MQFIPVLRNSKNPLDQLLFENCSQKYTIEFVLVNDGKCCLSTKYLDLAERVANWPVQDTDVFVLSYPKSGTTWLQEMVWCIAHDADLERAKSQKLNSRFPYLDFTIMTSWNNVDFDETPPRSTSIDSLEYVARKAAPRFIKCHLPWELLPADATNGSRRCKLLYIMRDPLDVCVSYYHNLVHLGIFTGTIQQFVTLFVNNRALYGSQCAHALGVWRQRHRNNLLILRYEELKADLPGQIRRVARFLGKQLTDEQVAALEHHLSFDEMKNNRSINYRIPELEVVENTARLGQVGSYKEDLTPEMIDMINNFVAEELKNTDLQF